MEQQLIEKAIFLLERDGWITHKLGPIDPEVNAPRCVVGALAAASTLMAPIAAKPYFNCQDMICSAANIDATTSALTAWNDHQPSITTVITALKKARG